MQFNYLRRIYLSDTDAAGVVYFAKGLEICHQAYEESLAEQGISLKQMIQERKTALPIVHAEIDFLRPLFCGDRIQISLVASVINNSEFAIAYQIFHVDNLEQILVKAQTRHVCVNPQIRQRVDLPIAVLEWLTA
jgi:1,4-dihydroxy-2-naphthoyl-CoA hydrolase